jgi:beta-aspartyl-peptidase (threonine type)
MARSVARMARLFLVLAAIATLAEAQTAKSSRDEADIRSVLSRQVAAWNEKKLEDFMAGYWKSPQLSFFSGGKKIAGWDATLERYRRNYQSEGREMGQLAFSELDVQTLSPTAAVVRGRFELTLSNGTKPTGIFTLIFRKFGQEWKVIHDHTSSDPVS